MSVPGLQNVAVAAVLGIVQKECRAMTREGSSVLQRTTPADLKDFKWDNVLSEWSRVAPTFLMFLKAGAAVSEQRKTTSRRKLSTIWQWQAAPF